MSGLVGMSLTYSLEVGTETMLRSFCLITLGPSIEGLAFRTFSLWVCLLSRQYFIQSIIKTVWFKFKFKFTFATINEITIEIMIK